MPVLKRPDGEIYYEEFGNGFPILLFAPGGLRSRLEMWHHPKDGSRRSWNDWTDVLASKYRVVAMDQRNAGQSKTAIKADHGWHTYAADHLALMDHLGHKRFHVMGGCIGGSFCFKLCEMAPERVTAAVLQNPIGFHENRATWDASLSGFGQTMRERDSGISEAALASFGRNLFGSDFVFPSA